MREAPFVHHLLCRWECEQLPKIPQLIRAWKLLTYFIIVISCSLFPVEHNHAGQSPVAASRWNEASRWERTEHLQKKKTPAQNVLVFSPFPTLSIHVRLPPTAAWAFCKCDVNNKQPHRQLCSFAHNWWEAPEYPPQARETISMSENRVLH